MSKIEVSNDMMKPVTYQGVFEPTAGSGFSVYFPDLPGCASYGATLIEAQKNAQDALELHLYGMEKDGDQIPAPSAIPEIDPETAPGYLVYPVTAFPSLIRDELDNRLLHYKGYTARPEYSTEDRIFYGKILGISDMVDFQSENAKGLEDEFHKAVDDYLAFCAEIGREPQRGHIGMKTIPVSELAANTDKYIEIAQIQDVFIAENRKVVARLTAYTE